MATHSCIGMPCTICYPPAFTTTATAGAFQFDPVQDKVDRLERIIATLVARVELLESK